MQQSHYNVAVNASGFVPVNECLFLEPDSVEGVYVGYVGYGAFKIQHMGLNGERLWGDEGIDLEVNGPAWPEPADFTLGADRNHCFATLRGDTLYAFKFTPEGNAVWGDGIMIPDLGHETVLSADGTGGFVELYRDYENYQYDLNASRIGSDGNAVWGVEGVYIGNVSFEKSVLCHAPYIYTFWREEGYFLQARLDKLDYSGNRVWPESLNPFSESRCQVNLNMADAGNSGLVFFCTQSNDISTTSLTSQKCSYDGVKLWGEEGLLVSSRDLPPGSLDAAPTESGGGVFSWYEIDPLYGSIICAAMVNAYGELGVVGIRQEESNKQPVCFSILPAFPNPFNATAVLSFQLPVAGLVRLDIFDVNGRDVGARSPRPHTVGFGESRKGLTTDLRWYPPGTHQITIDGSNLPSGIYLARLTADLSGSGATPTMRAQKLVLLK